MEEGIPLSVKDLRSLNLEEMKLQLQEIGLPSFRAKQIFQWVHQKGVRDLPAMSNLGGTIQAMLAQHLRITAPVVLRRLVARDGNTAKFLLQLDDGKMVETVLMSYAGTRNRHRETVCVSTQVGCAIRCAFCATGLAGWERNLSVGEMISQVLVVQDYLGFQKRVSNVVFMGMGEPLANFEAVLKTVDILNDPLGLDIGARRMTISTSGLVPRIYKLADLRLQITLAVSLHAPTDELRDRLVPVNHRYPLRQLLPACDYYAEVTGRRVTFEYALLKGINDSPKEADQLARLLRGRLANVNLIPVNPVEGTGYYPPERRVIKDFQGWLQQSGITASIREEKGVEIDAACGQLKGRLAGEKP